MLVREWLAREQFTLSMSTTFFGYWAHSGALLALTEAGLRPNKVTGSSAGAVVAGLYGAGYDPGDEMAKLFEELKFKDLLEFRPSLYWGFPVVGFYRQRLDALEEKCLGPESPAEGRKAIEDCRVPVAVSVYDAGLRKNRVVRSGRLAAAIAASAAVPVMMRGVPDGGSLLLDGGVGGDFLGIDGVDPQDKVLVVNLFVRAFMPETPSLPEGLVLDIFGVPFVTPVNLEKMGPIARQKAYDAMRKALDSPLPAQSPGQARRMGISVIPSNGDAPSDRDDDGTEDPPPAHQRSWKWTPSWLGLMRS